MYVLLFFYLIAKYIWGWKFSSTSPYSVVLPDLNSVLPLVQTLENSQLVNFDDFVWFVGIFAVGISSGRISFCSGNVADKKAHDLLVLRWEGMREAGAVHVLWEINLDRTHFFSEKNVNFNYESWSIVCFKASVDQLDVGSSMNDVRHAWEILWNRPVLSSRPQSKECNVTFEQIFLVLFAIVGAENQTD